MALVAVATARDPLTKEKRGITVGSFTSLSLSPPIVSFSIRLPSRMDELLNRVEDFNVQLLSESQVQHSLLFSSAAENGDLAFNQVPHYFDAAEQPVLLGCLAVLKCKPHSSSLVVGDHRLYLGRVVGIDEGHGEKDLKRPLLYFRSSYRSIGDEAFIKAFEDRTLLFENWTHQVCKSIVGSYPRLKPLFRHTFGWPGTTCVR